VFWESDIENEEAKLTCHQCGDTIANAVRDIHFKVISISNRNLKISDFKKYGDLKSSEKKKIQSYLAKNAQIFHLSQVKPKFEKRAIAEWVPNGMSEEVSIKV